MPSPLEVVLMQETALTHNIQANHDKTLRRFTFRLVDLCFEEIERYEALVKRMVANLADLKRAIKGEIGMSQDLDALGSSMFNGLVPSAWTKIAPQTEKPLGSWMDHFVRRYTQYSEWAEKGDPPVFWLSGFHIPESLLSALVQASCRRRGWALDKSTLYTKALSRFRLLLLSLRLGDEVRRAEPSAGEAHGRHLRGGPVPTHVAKRVLRAFQQVLRGCTMGYGGVSRMWALCL